MTTLTGMATAAVLPLSILSAPSQANDSRWQDWIDQRIGRGSDRTIAIMQFADGEATCFFGGVLGDDPDRRPNRRTRFEIGSISKVFTNLLLGELAATGGVSFDTTIGEVLGPGFAPANPAVANISLQSLATHTSGLPRLPANFEPSDPSDPYRGYDADQLIEAVAQARAGQPLGSHYAYSNFGAGLLGFLLGKRHGAGYHAALKDVVIDPMGLIDMGFAGGHNAAVGFRAGQSVPSWSTDDAMAGAGALWGSLQDFERVTRIVLGLTESDLRQPPQAWKTVVVDDAHGFELSRAWHVGRANGHPVFWHNGGTGGFWSFYGFRPDTGAAIAMLVAGDSDPTDEGLRFLGHEFRAPRQVHVDEQIVGRYQLTADFFIDVYRDQGLPFAQPTGQGAWPLSRLGNDWFAFDEVDASIRLVRSGPTVTGLQLVQNGVVVHGDKVEDAAVRVRPTAIDLPLSLLQQYVGEYELAAGLRLTVRSADGALVVGLTGQSFYPVFAAQQDHFFYEVVDAQLQFERDDAGDVVALILLQGGVEQRARRLE